ncbi:unnamed protein product [Orchesella dallaii]|uniref:ENTH domain-containing protein n=1 Tax=Orchesella dallaii TaxID=48710 RepID=A0ABP1R9G2_9HEXA
MWKVRELADKVTNVVMNYTEIEAKVREATNDDPWGPTGTLKHELSQATYSYDLFPEVMGMLWKRIAENKRSPRRIYKSLLVLHHLLLHGSDRVVRATQDRLYEVRQLQDYHAVEDPGFTLNAIIPASGTETKDGEANVRHKAKEMVELIQDEERLRDERKKARKNRDKYVGIGSDKMMTSKWSDDYDYGNNEDEKSSPPSRSKSKPYSDSDADFSRSMSSSSNNNFRSKPSPPSPAMEAEDFDPRGGEANDFGDFRSAPTIAATTKTASLSFPSAASNNTSSDFADFQSAFSETTSASVETASLSVGQAANNQQSDDLLGLSFDIGGGSGGTSQSSGLSSFNAPSSSNFLPQLGGPVGFQSGITSPVAAAPARQPVSLPGAFPPMGIPANNLQTPSPVVQFPSPVGFPQQQTSLVQTSAVPPAQFQQQQPMSMTSFSNDDALDLFGSSSSVPAAPVLQPATKASNGAIPSSNSASNNINNNSNPSLKGTTWSDLNISLSDLNLSRSNSKNSPVKTTINQMRAPSTTAANNFAAFK